MVHINGMLCLTKRTATLSQKTRIQLANLCQSQLIRLYVQPRGNAMEHNGYLPARTENLKRMATFFFSPESTAAAGSQKHQNTPKRERLLFLPFYSSLGNLSAPPRVRNRSPVLRPSPAAAATPRHRHPPG